MSDNRRQQIRSRMLQRARIVLNNGFTSVECIVMDVSEGGARLKLAGWIQVPPEFELRMQDRPPVRVALCHRTPDYAGVRFIGAAT